MQGATRTTCKNCIFAEWDGQQQSGCSFNRLEKFKEREEAKLIDGVYEIQRLCNACTKGPILDHTLDEVRQIVRSNITPKVDFIILSDGASKQEIYNIYNCVSKQSILPKNVYHIIQGKVEYKEVYSDLFKRYKDLGIKCWTVSVLDNDSLSEGIRKCTNQFYSIFKCSDEIPNHFIRRIDDLLNEDLTKFLCILGEDISGTTFMTRTNNLFSYSTPIEERIDFLKANVPEMVLEWK